MIISRTPYRISFFGGGTDYPAWYLQHGGAVLATAIDKYCYLTCRHLPPFFEHQFRIVYSQIEHTRCIEDIRHPAVRAVLQELKVDRGVEIHHDGDLPARSGMGSSSAFTVGLLHAIYALQGQIPSDDQLARKALLIEQEILQEIVGSQDQVMAACGGLNHITFLPDGKFYVQPITLSPARLGALNAHLMLFYTGIVRTASDVAASYALDVDRCKRQLRLMRELVEEGMGVLKGDADLTAFGELLHEAWLVKRSLSALISSSEIDALYAEALSAGAIGGKLTGAGGGGFLLLFVPPDRQQAVRERLCDLIHVPFQFEHRGSRIIYFEPEEDYAAVEQIRLMQKVPAFREPALLAS